MSIMAALGPLSEYAPTRSEKREDVEAAQEQSTEQSQDDFMAAFTKSANEQQDQKTTVQSFQYTGKGSFIDKVF